MISPTIDDIDRKVVYRPRPDADPEEGVLSSLCKDQRYAFVRFRGPNGELTPTDKLDWLA